MNNIKKDREEYFLKLITFGVLISALVLFATAITLYRDGYARDDGIYVNSFTSNGQWLIFFLSGIALLYFGIRFIRGSRRSNLADRILLPLVALGGIIINAAWFIEVSLLS